MLQVEFTLTEEEYLNYIYYTNWLMPEKKLFRIRYYLLFPVITFIVVLFVLFLFDNTITTSSLLLSAAIAVIMAFLVPFRIKTAFKEKIKKILKSPENEKILSQTQITIDEKGISGRNKVVEMKYKWDAFSKKIISNDCYYLYTTSAHAVVIPARALRNKEEKEKFEEYLLRYLPLDTVFTQL